MVEFSSTSIQDLPIPPLLKEPGFLLAVGIIILTAVLLLIFRPKSRSRSHSREKETRRNEVQTVPSSHPVLDKRVNGGAIQELPVLEPEDQHDIGEPVVDSDSGGNSESAGEESRPTHLEDVLAISESEVRRLSVELTRTQKELKKSKGSLRRARETIRHLERKIGDIPKKNEREREERTKVGEGRSRVRVRATDADAATATASAPHVAVGASGSAADAADAVRGDAKISDQTDSRGRTPPADAAAAPGENVDEVPSSRDVAPRISSEVPVPKLKPDIKKSPVIRPVPGAARLPVRPPPQVRGRGRARGRGGSRGRRLLRRRARGRFRGRGRGRPTEPASSSPIRQKLVPTASAANVARRAARTNPPAASLALSQDDFVGRRLSVRPEGMTPMPNMSQKRPNQRLSSRIRKRKVDIEKMLSRSQAAANAALAPSIPSPKSQSLVGRARADGGGTGPRFIPEPATAVPRLQSSRSSRAPRSPHAGAFRLPGFGSRGGRKMERRQ